MTTDTPSSNELSDEKIVELRKVAKYHIEPAKKWAETLAFARTVIAADRAIRPAADASKPAVAVEEMRREFEAAFAGKLNLKPCQHSLTGGYRDSDTDTAWDAYQRGYEAATSACAALGWRTRAEKADAERMEWLNLQGDFSVYSVPSIPHDRELCLHDAEVIHKGENLRQCIDATRAGKGE